MWRTFLPNSKISYIEVDKRCGERYRKQIEKTSGGILYLGSQDDPALLQQIIKDAERFGGYDVIIDDGSHLNDHISASFRNLWRALKPGGIYVVEDLQAVLWTADEGLERLPSFLEMIRTMFIHVQCLTPTYRNRLPQSMIKFCKEDTFGVFSMECMPEACLFVKA